MIIYQDTKTFFVFLKQITRKPIFYLILIPFITFCTVSALGYISFYSLGERINSNIKNIFNFNVSKNSTKELLKKIEYPLNSLKNIHIDLGFKALKRIEYSRKRSIKNNNGLFEKNDWVNANIRFQGEEYEIKIRLKGTYPDHWSGKTGWSFRVNVKNGKSILGLKRFNLMQPERRGKSMEWFFMKALKREGLIAHQVGFINVFINGESWGLYTFQDQYDKILIERNGFREGPIIGFNKDLMFAAVIQDAQLANTIWVSDSFWRAPIDIVQQNKTLTNPKLSELAKQGVYLLERFRDGTLETSQVFELEPLAKILAIKALLGSTEFDWRDSKFYMNPITYKLHLISKEIHHSGAIELHRWWVLNPSEPDGQSFQNLFFGDPNFLKEYFFQLKRIASERYLDDLISSISEELKGINSLIDPMPYLRIPKSNLQSRIIMIQALLTPPQGIHAYLSEKGVDYISVRIGAIQEVPVVIGCLYEGILKVACADDNLIISGKSLGKPVTYQKIRFKIKTLIKKIRYDQLKLHHNLPGILPIMKAPLLPVDIHNEKLSNHDLIKEFENIREIEWLEIDEVSRTIKIKQGEWDIRKSLVFPSGYLVTMSEGTRLNLYDNASIISKSRVKWVAVDGHKPIIITSPDLSGHGVFVQGAKERSELHNVHFSNLSAPKLSNSLLSGAVTFYQSDVTINSALFKQNRSGDDYLNIIRSDLDIKKSNFSNVLFDAIDMDFSTGSMQDVSFIKIGNDAIDVSGSEVKANNIIMSDIGDKGISVGESSIFKVKNITINNSHIGLASKDNSHLEAVNIQIFNTKTSIAVYQKKSEYGPASVVVRTINSADHIYFVEQNSTLTVDNKIIE
jgi:hypothetical protein